MQVPQVIKIARVFAHNLLLSSVLQRRKTQRFNSHGGALRRTNISGDEYRGFDPRTYFFSHLD